MYVLPWKSILGSSDGQGKQKPIGRVEIGRNMCVTVYNLWPTTDRDNRRPYILV